MSVEEIKHCIASLPPEQQAEVSAFLYHLRHLSDAGYQHQVSSRIADRDPTHWLTPEEFERRLDGR